MSADEFTPKEREVIYLLRSNDPTAAEKLVSLSDAERVRVLAHVTSTSGEDDPAAEKDDEVSGEPPSASQSLPPETAKTRAARKPRFGALGQLRSRTSKIVLAVLGVALLAVFVVLVRACGDDGGGESRALLLVRESSSDLYIVNPGQEVDRANRAVHDIVDLRGIEVTSGGVSSATRFPALGARHVIVARTQDGEAVWVIDGDDYQQITGSESSTVSAVVVGEILYVKEENEGTQRCYRGPPNDLERVSRGDHCDITRSGHVFIADRSDDSHRIRVESPAGDELLRANFPTRPAISANGLFLVVVEEHGVIVTSVETGDRVWGLEDGVGYDFASHRDGYLAIAAQAADGELVLAIVDTEGNAYEVAEIVEGSLVAEFSGSGNLFWTETGEGSSNLLSAWDASQRDVIELGDEEDLGLVGVFEDSAVTATEDDFGVLFQRFLLDGSVRELHEFEEVSGLRFVLIEGDYLYAVGNELASVVPLREGEAVDSEPWDQLSALDHHDGSLVLAGTDGSSEVLFRISAGSSDDVEYGQYDAIGSAQIYGDTLYASVRGGSRVDTLAFDVSSGDELDDEDYGGYELVNVRRRSVTDTLSARASQSAAPVAVDETPVSNSRVISGEAYADYYEADLIDQRGIVVSRSGSIDSAGDSDLYVFESPDSASLSGGGPLIVETFGSMDTVVDLYRIRSLGDESRVLSDDDGGEGNSSLIETWVEPGWYIVIVRGYEDSTGGYGVRFWVP